MKIYRQLLLSLTNWRRAFYPSRCTRQSGEWSGGSNWICGGEV